MLKNLAKPRFCANFTVEFKYKGVCNVIYTGTRNKFAYWASDGLGQSLDNGYFSMSSELAPIKKQLFVPHLYDNRNLALANPITAYTTASEYNVIAMASVRAQKKR